MTKLDLAKPVQTREGDPVRIICTDRKGEPAGWMYEFHEFGDVWKRHAILNRPNGGANPPTKHYGSEVRNVRPLYTSQSGEAAMREACAAYHDGKAREAYDRVAEAPNGWLADYLRDVVKRHKLDAAAIRALPLPSDDGEVRS